MFIKTVGASPELFLFYFENFNKKFNNVLIIFSDFGAQYCTTLTFLLLQVFSVFFNVTGVSVYECAWYNNTFLVQLSLGNKVVLHY